MTTSALYFLHAQLSLAAYANLPTGNPDETALQVQAEMSASQAARFAEGWRVADQYTHSEEFPIYGDAGNVIGYSTTSNGLSVTVFEEVPGGKKYLSIRGTDDFVDLLTDMVDIGYFGSPKGQAQYASLKEKVEEWMANGTLPSSFTVTGHSLGGFLAGALLVDFPTNVEHAYLFNAPGIGGVFATAGLALKNIMGLAVEPTLDLARVSNLKAVAGISPVSGLGVQLATPIPIIIESQFVSDVPNPPIPAYNHSQRVLSDAVAVYDLYGTLAPTLSVEQIGSMLRAASGSNNRTLENALDALRVLVTGPAALGAGQTPTEGRDRFFEALYALKDSATYRALAGSAAVRVTAESDAATLGARAVQDFGYFLAVRYLLPVAIEGGGSALIGAHSDLYARWNADNAKRIAGTGSLEFTDAYFTDRAQMLAFLNTANTNDTNALASNQVSDQLLYRDLVKRPVPGSTEGKPTELLVFLGGTPNFRGPNTRIVGFGTDAADGLLGRDNTDRLYGGLGADVLTGGKANDYLEGGAGHGTHTNKWSWRAAA